MKQTRRTPGLSKARLFLAKLHTEEPRALSATSVRSLAERCDVSYVTMWKAMHETRRGQAVTRPLSNREQIPTVPRWRAAFLALCEDLRRGVYASGTVLPKIALLLDRYGVSQPTFRRALTLAVEEKLLTVHRRSWRVHTLSRGESSGTVCVVVRKAPPGEQHSSGYYAYMRTVEQTCARLSVRPRVIPCEINGSWHRLAAEDERFLDSLDTQPHMIGALCILRGIYPEHTVPLVDRFIRFGKPVALLDERAELSLPPHLNSGGLVKHFSYSASTRCGRDMGTFLGALGHRKVVYLAPHDSPLWSVMRFEGLRQALDVQVSSAEVKAFTLRGHALSESAMRVRTEAAQVINFANSEVGTVHEKQARKAAAALIRTADNLSSIARTTRQAGQSGSVHYEQFLNERSLTAWVGANDSIALDALRFLADKGVNVPGEISVVGFDDTEEAFLQQMTSYNFNVQAVMQAMLDHVLRYGLQRCSRAANGPDEIEGFIAQRATSGRAMS